ncbi:MAG TPA: TonB-dependent receptor [Candidatus Acidoferrum sp.]|nr:TonB-dependent receptor [Candidatus Acidoferrum sp.]
MASPSRRALALTLLLACVPVGARAESLSSASPPAAAASLRGSVVDAATGLPIAGAAIVVAGRPERAVTGSDGRFTFPSLPPGLYRLRVARPGYQSAQSDDVALVSGGRVSVTLAVQHETATSALRTIGATSTNAAVSLQRATTISQTITTDVLQQRGVERAGDALRALPGIGNSIAGDTAAFGDDIPLDIRGIGSLESTTEIDEHPIAYGFPGGYNFQVSPIAPFREVGVTYGSGSNLLGTSAIGGVFDFRTLVPTPDLRVTLDQGYGTFDKQATNVTATGTTGRLGYAFAYGASGIDGPITHQRNYQPAAAYDVTATSPAVRDIGVYDADSSVSSHNGLAKLQYDLTPSDRLTATGVFAGYYENKTGNGDADWLDLAPALAFAKQKVGGASSACPGGVAVTNGGRGPGGVPDGGSPCVSATQYAADTAGWQGAGPSYQTFNLGDYQLAYEHTVSNRLARVAVFSDHYDDYQSRQFRLPFNLVPGDRFSITSNGESEGGVVASYDISGRNNTVGAAFNAVNTAFALARDTSTASSFASPVVHQDTYALRDVYRAAGSPFSIFANVALTQASATHSSSLDPRLTLLDNLTPHDVLRFSAGATTTQPAGNQLDQPFAPQVLGSAGGGGGVKCAGLNAIGSVASSALHPERGVDQEVAYAHGFGGDSFVQGALYNTNVYDKLYAALIPISTTGTGFIPGAFLAQQLAFIASQCGGVDPSTLAGVSGTFNIGTMRARGFVVSGRQRIDRRTAIDYAWTLDSTALLSVPSTYLQSNLNIVPGGQLPGLPLHTLDASVDRLVGRALTARYTYHWVADNNSKRLPAYDYSDLRLSLPLGRGTLSVEVDNLFNQWADIRGLLYEGEPYALNAYATTADYAPYTGAAASERFGLPNRTVFLDYSVRMR